MTQPNHITVTEALKVPGLLMDYGAGIPQDYADGLQKVARGSYEPDLREAEGSSEEEFMASAYQAARDKTARLVALKSATTRFNLDFEVTVTTEHGSETHTVFEWLVLDPVHIRKARSNEAKNARRDPYGDKKPREKSPLELELEFLESALTQLKSEERTIAARNREKEGRNEVPVSHFHRPSYEKRAKYLRAILALDGPLDSALSVANTANTIPANPGVES